MTPAEHRQVVEIAKLTVHEYFDHYLTDVFPKQTRALFASHNQDAQAHDPRFAIHSMTCPTKRRVDRMKWMLAGGSAVGGFVAAFVVQHWSEIIGLVLRE